MTGIRLLFIIGFVVCGCVFHAPTPALADQSNPTKLFRSLTGRSEKVRIRSLQSVSQPHQRRMVLDDLIAAAKKLAGETESNELARHSTVSLIYLIARVDDARSESLLVDLLDAPHLGIAMVSADALGQNKFYGAIDYLKKQVDRPEYARSYGFRFNLVRALAQMEHPDAVDFLTELRTTLDGQLRYQIDLLLDEVTVEHFRGDDERFEKWKAQAKPDSIFKEASFEPESLNRIRLERQQYYGIDIHAKRLMFIIDHSGSMKHYWGGLTRLERAKGELIRSITELPEDNEFAIVFYHSTVRQWRDKLVPATEDNKREAIQFVRKLGYGSKTNTYGALRMSLEFDDDLEAVFLLTDGKPTTGNIIAPVGIVNDVLHRNRFRHINFNTIGIGVQGKTKSFLQRLAEESNGEFREAG